MSRSFDNKGAQLTAIRGRHRFEKPDFGILCQSCAPPPPLRSRPSSSVGLSSETSASSSTKRRRTQAAEAQRKLEEQQRDRFWGFFALIIEYKLRATLKTLGQTIAYLLIAYQMCGTRIAICWVGHTFSRVYLIDGPGNVPIVHVETGTSDRWNTSQRFSDLARLRPSELAWDLQDKAKSTAIAPVLYDPAVKTLAHTLFNVAQRALAVCIDRPPSVHHLSEFFAGIGTGSDDNRNARRLVGVTASPGLTDPASADIANDGSREMQLRAICAAARPGARGVGQVFARLHPQVPLAADAQVTRDDTDTDTTQTNDSISTRSPPADDTDDDRDDDREARGADDTAPVGSATGPAADGNSHRPSAGGGQDARDPQDGASSSHEQRTVLRSSPTASAAVGVFGERMIRMYRDLPVDRPQAEA